MLAIKNDWENNNNLLISIAPFTYNDQALQLRLI